MRFLTERRFFLILVVAGVYGLYSLAFASSGSDAGDSGPGHGGPVLDVLLQLIVVLLAAKLGGDLLERFRQPAVLGELIIGMVIGNLSLVGFHYFEAFTSNQILEVLAELVNAAK